MSAWATRRQLSFILTFVLLLIFAMVVFVATNREIPTCTDGKANQGELGIDCGGPCAKVCSIETNDLIVLWSRAFKLREGIYDAAAYIENPNPFSAPRLPYLMRLYDSENIPVKDVSGEIYLNAHERALIFAPAVDVGFRVPTRAFVTFPEPPDWERPRGNLRKPVISIRNQAVERNESLVVRAVASNDSLFPLNDIEFYAFLYDGSGNVIHASQTFVSRLEDGASSEIVFTWPDAFLGDIAGVDIFSRVNLFDWDKYVGETAEQ